MHILYATSRKKYKALDDIKDSFRENAISRQRLRFDMWSYEFTSFYTYLSAFIMFSGH